MPKLLIVKAFGIFIPVEATGFEPTTSASRTQRSTKLSHASIFCFLNSRPSTIAIIYDVYRNVNTFFEIFLIFFIIASKGTFYTGLRPFWCSFRMTVSEKVKKKRYAGSSVPAYLLSLFLSSADIHLHTARRSSAPRNGCCRRCLRGRKRFRGLLPCKPGR